MNHFSKIVVTDNSGVEHTFVECEKTEHYLDFKPVYGDYIIPNALEIITRKWTNNRICDTQTTSTFINPRRVDVIYTTEKAKGGVCDGR